MREDEDALAARLVALEGSGLVTVDEARTAMGYDPWGGEYAEPRKRPDPSAMFQAGFSEGGADQDEEEREANTIEVGADGQ